MIIGSVWLRRLYALITMKHWDYCKIANTEANTQWTDKMLLQFLLVLWPIFGSEPVKLLRMVSFSLDFIECLFCWPLIRQWISFLWLNCYKIKHYLVNTKNKAFALFLLWHGFCLTFTNFSLLSEPMNHAHTYHFQAQWQKSHKPNCCWTRNTL